MMSISSKLTSEKQQGLKKLKNKPPSAQSDIFKLFDAVMFSLLFVINHQFKDNEISYIHKSNL
jgi:hypothetical protein